MLEYLLPVIDGAVRDIASEPITDQEDCAAMVGATVNYFTLRDAEKYRVVSVEDKFTVPLPGSFFQIYGTTDLRFLDSQNRLIIPDWKTVTSFDKDVIERYEVGWQKKIYLWATGADEFRYRLIKKPEMADPTYGLACRELVYVVEDKEELAQQVETHLMQATDVLRALDGSEPWLMNAPHACKAYGRECPFRRTCPAHGGKAPHGSFEKHEINNSGINSLLLCPERYRQTLIAMDSGQKDVEGSPATRLGQAFHTAMAKIYSAIKSYQSNVAAAIKADVDNSQIAA